MKLKQEFELREVGEKYLLVPVDKSAAKTNGLFQMNGTGAFLWKRIPDANSEEDLVNAVLEVYDVSRELAAAGVEAFMASLRAREII